MTAWVFVILVIVVDLIATIRLGRARYKEGFSEGYNSGFDRAAALYRSSDNVPAGTQLPPSRVPTPPPVQAPKRSGGYAPLRIRPMPQPRRP